MQYVNCEYNKYQQFTAKYYNTKSGNTARL